MTELTSKFVAAEEAANNAGYIHRRMKRIKRTAHLVGLVGAREGVMMLTERLINPNSDYPHFVKIDELEHPFQLTAAHSDIAMFNEIIGEGTYDLPGLDDRIDGRPIIDLGANIGVATALFATRYPQSPVIAVEAHPRNFGVLEQNSRAYGERITPVEKAIGLEPGYSGLVNPDITRKGHHAVYEFRTGEHGDVMAEVLTPEELIAITEQQMPEQGRVGLLKINIEGEERNLLASRRMDSLLARTNVAIIEAHDRKASGTSDVVQAAAARTGLRQFDKRGSFLFFES